MKKYLKSVIPLILIIIAFTVFVVFEFVDITYTDDKLIDRLLNESLPRLFAGGALIAITFLLGSGKYLKISFKQLPRNLLWCIPCFLVVVANFPFTAIISGNAEVLRTDLIWLLLIKCLAIGLMEELLFRGLLQEVISGFFVNKRYSALLTVAVTSAVFALFHLLNLISGAGIGATFMQVGYSFLIGAMLSAVLIKTENIWLCVILHTIFDFGGYIITDLGAGKFQDVWFWVFTAVAGVICLIHVLYFLLKQQDKCTESE